VEAGEAPGWSRASLRAIIKSPKGPPGKLISPAGSGECLKALNGSAFAYLAYIKSFNEAQIKRRRKGEVGAPTILSG